MVGEVGFDVGWSVAIVGLDVVGSSKEGRPDWKLVIFPSLVWLIMWSGAFWLGDYYARAFAGGPPEFTVLGFHPSFAAIIILFWIVPTLLMGFGFEAVKDRWLSEERWDEFVRKIHEPHETDEEQS